MNSFAGINRSKVLEKIEVMQAMMGLLGNKKLGRQGVSPQNKFRIENKW